MANQSSMFVGRQEILGEDEILGANFDDDLNPAQSVEEFIGEALNDDLDRVQSVEDFIGEALNDDLDRVQSVEDFIGRGGRRGGHQRRVQRLQSRAASGDTHAQARLQRMEQNNPGSTNSTSSSQQSFNYPASYNPQPPAVAQSAYNPYGAQQSPYYNPYADPQQPTDYYIQGDDDLTEIISSGAFVGEDELELAREGGSSEKSALLRRKGSGSCGFNSKWTNIRGEDSSSDLDKIKKLAAGGNKKAKRILAKITSLAAQSKTSGDAVDTDLTSKQAARQILSTAASAKTITRSDLKKAIWLYAGKQSTEKERTAVGSKMLTFLNKRQVKLS